MSTQLTQIYDRFEIHHPHTKKEPNYIMQLPHWQHVQIETEKGWTMDIEEIEEYFRDKQMTDKPPMGHYYVHKGQSGDFFISYAPDSLPEVLANITYLPLDLLNKLNWCKENNRWFTLPVIFSMNLLSTELRTADVEEFGKRSYFGKILWKNKWYFYAEKLYDHSVR